MPIISRLAPAGLLEDIADLASQSLTRVLWLATGRPTWNRESIAAYTAPSLKRHGLEWRPVVVSTALLHQALATQSPRHISPEGGNYRCRYGTHGDREVYKNLITSNQAWHLPSLMLMRSGYTGQHFLTVYEENDAGYVAAMLRDNDWDYTTVLCPEQDVGYFRNIMQPEPPAFPQLKGEFKMLFGEVMAAALDALSQGAIIGEAVKHSPALSIGGFRTHDSAWLYQGRIVSSDTLVHGDVVPAPALVTQVHHALVSAMAGPGGSKPHRVPEEVLKFYQSHGGFAWHC